MPSHKNSLRVINVSFPFMFKCYRAKFEKTVFALKWEIIVVKKEIKKRGQNKTSRKNFLLGM